MLSEEMLRINYPEDSYDIKVEKNDGVICYKITDKENSNNDFSINIGQNYVVIKQNYGRQFIYDSEARLVADIITTNKSGI